RDAGDRFENLIAPERHAGAKVLLRMMDRGVNAPLTSSAGRLFDAVAAIAGLRSVVSFEGQAAMELEWQAAATPEDGEYPHELLSANGSLELDTRPLIRAAAADARAGHFPGTIARRFHHGLAAAVAAVCVRLRDRTGIAQVVLTGGVFLNAVLTTECTERLEREGLRVMRHRIVPPNDGGLSLGQLAVAAARSSVETRAPD
ncbi:MAG: carbamoyltransferase HypF, partial [Chloroflexota bacterium]|nr:carbamoyltransferase HypF [Chloroflexota bacterium]